MPKTMRDALKKTTLALVPLMVVVTSSWVADGLKGECLFAPWFGACEGNSFTLLCRTLLSGLLFGFFALAAFRLAKNFIPVKHLQQSDKVKAAKVLITSLSPFDCTYTKNGQGRLTAKRKNQDGTETSISLNGNIDTDIDALKKCRPREQQFLRALRPHLPNIEHLILLGSNDTKGSFNSLDFAQTLAQVYLPPNVNVCPHMQALDFEDIRALQEVMEDWIKHFRVRGIADRHIMIDVTGGFKTASIAAALTTLHSQGIQFQYVQTQPKDDKPLHAIGFNVISTAQEKPTNP